MYTSSPAKEAALAFAPNPNPWEADSGAALKAADSDAGHLGTPYPILSRTVTLKEL